MYALFLTLCVFSSRQFQTAGNRSCCGSVLQTSLAVKYTSGAHRPQAGSRVDCSLLLGAATAHLVQRPIKMPGAILTRVRVPRAARDFSPRVSFQCRLWCLYSPRVQSHASTSARTLKIPNTGSHTIVRKQENAAHTDRNG